MIAVSLNVGCGVCLIKPAKLCMCTQNTTNTMRTAAWHVCVRQWFRTAEPLGERRYENSNTHIFPWKLMEGCRAPHTVAMDMFC